MPAFFILPKNICLFLILCYNKDVHEKEYASASIYLSFLKLEQKISTKKPAILAGFLFLQILANKWLTF